MEIFQIRIFQHQVFDQCKFLVFSAQQLDLATKQGDMDGIFYSIQNLLNSGANISKLLFGSGGRKSEERKPLRDSIGVADDSPLRDVTMRNNFEHVDERIDRWWENSPTRNIADRLVGPKGRVVVGPETIGMFRQYDPFTAEVIFWDQEFNLKSLVDEVQRIIPKVREESQKPHWEPVRPVATTGWSQS
jgi:hypothetical protein